MALFKCKMCGGDLEIAEGVTIAECEYCGTKQTVPKAMDENLQNLFNRANTLRIKSEFDKAEKLYEKIIQADTTQSEAYWGLILCKYGIEYVDDPATFKKIPTCHRASYDSIIADDDYKSALKNSDMSQRAIYEAQAKEIDRIQKDILALSQKEETYDVFICYKETDADGKRTQDSVIANDIYYQLTNEGFKVFYAAITLEGKLGSAYEPIIFAALNSAKVMLSIGTRSEYFNAVWVKNEWLRFLNIIKKDRSKVLIPCYRDMDAYELPEEFAHLQAQDMAKIGFINDLVRGIKKVVKKDEPKAARAVKETVVSSASANATPLVRRAFMFLEDSKWDEADEYCERALDIDPEYAEAYLVKLLVELKLQSKDKLAFNSAFIDQMLNFKKAIKYGTPAFVNELMGYSDSIKTTYYNRAIKALNQAQTVEDCQKAAKFFDPVLDFKDSKEKQAECNEKGKKIIYDNAVKKSKSAQTSEDYQKAAEMFNFILDFKDSKEKQAACYEKSNELIYNDAVKKLESAQTSQEAELAAGIFGTILNFRDSKDKQTACHEKSKKIIYDNAVKKLESAQTSQEAQLAANMFGSILDFKDSKEKRAACCEKAKKIIYADAFKRFESIQNAQDAEAASYVFKSIYDFKDAKEKYAACTKLSRWCAQIRKLETEKDSYSGARFLVICGIVGLLFDLFRYNVINSIFLIIIEIIVVMALFVKGVYSCFSLLRTNIKLKKLYKNKKKTMLSELCKYEGALNVRAIAQRKAMAKKVAHKEKLFPKILVTILTIGIFALWVGMDIAPIAWKNVTENGIEYSKTGDVYSVVECRFYNIDQNIVIPEEIRGLSVTSIGEWAFSSCSSLTSITIPDSVTSIGESAFSSCSSLTSITIPDSVTSIGACAFNYTAYYDNGENWTDGVLYIGNHFIKAETNISGSYNIKSGTKCIADSAFFSCSNLTSITIPDSVAGIGNEAFLGCRDLTSITIPDGVTSIGEMTFSCCYDLTSVTIPDSVTSIGNYAFHECYYLMSIAIPNGVTSIGESAFSSCSSLTSITIPDSVTSIGDDAFFGCNMLKSVTMPNSVTSIGWCAFSNCTRLASIHFEGTQAQWKAIDKDSTWKNGSGSVTIYCTDGNISE